MKKTHPQKSKHLRNNLAHTFNTAVFKSVSPLLDLVDLLGGLLIPAAGAKLAHEDVHGALIIDPRSSQHFILAMCPDVKSDLENGKEDGDEGVEEEGGRKHVEKSRSDGDRPQVVSVDLVLLQDVLLGDFEGDLVGFVVGGLHFPSFLVYDDCGDGFTGFLVDEVVFAGFVVHCYVVYRGNDALVTFIIFRV